LTIKEKVLEKRKNPAPKFPHYRNKVCSLKKKTSQDTEENADYLRNNMN
jgi:hypothetical protein